MGHGSLQYMFTTRVFCYLMSHVLLGLDFCFVYLDDILVYSTSWKEHLKHLEMVLKCPKEGNLTIRFSKCQFFKKNLHYPGHLISEQGIKPLLKKVIAIENFKGPSNKDNHCHFLGLTGDYSSCCYLPT